MYSRTCCKARSKESLLVYSDIIYHGHRQAYDDALPLPVRAFAFWSFWMFTIPSLRARKPGKIEKKALDIAFLVTPVVSLGMPFVTQVRLMSTSTYCLSVIVYD